MAGPVAQAMGITTNPHGTPASAKMRAASIAPPAYVSGLVLHWKFETIGHSCSADSPPAASRAISTTPRAGFAFAAVIIWMCFLVLAN